MVTVITMEECFYFLSRYLFSTRVYSFFDHLSAKSSQTSLKLAHGHIKRGVIRVLVWNPSYFLLSLSSALLILALEVCLLVLTPFPFVLLASFPLD